MTRKFIPSFAVSLILAAATVPAVVGLAALASPAVACDCTNCSAQHCKPKPKGNVQYDWKVEEGTSYSTEQMAAPTVNRPTPRTPRSTSILKNEKWIKGN
jgi:hypothetical protein